MALKSNFSKIASTSRSISIDNMRKGMDFSNLVDNSLSSYYAGVGNIPTGTKGQEGAIPSSGPISMGSFYEVQKFNYITTIQSSPNPTVANFPVVSYNPSGNFPRLKTIATVGRTSGYNYLQLYRTYDNLNAGTMLGAKISLNSASYGIVPVNIVNDVSSTYSYVVCSTSATGNLQASIVLVKIDPTLGSAPVFVKNFLIFDFSESYNVVVSDVVLGVSSDSVQTIAIVGRTTLLDFTNPRGFILYIKADGSEQRLVRYPVNTLLSGITYYNQTFYVTGTHLYGAEECRFVSSCNYNFTTFGHVTNWERAYYRGNTDDRSIDDAKITYNEFTGKLNIAGSFATYVYDAFFESYIYSGRTPHYLQIQEYDQTVSWSNYFGSKPTSSAGSLTARRYSVNTFDYNGGPSDEDLDFFVSSSFSSQSATIVGYHRITDDGLFRAQASFYQSSFSSGVYSGTAVVPFISTTGFEFISPINVTGTAGSNFTALIRLPADLGVNYGSPHNMTIGSSSFTYTTAGYKTAPSSTGLTTYSLTPVSLSLTKTSGVVNPSDIAYTYTTIFSTSLSYPSTYKFNNF